MEAADRSWERVSHMTRGVEAEIYRTQQRVLAIGTGLLMRVIHGVIKPDLPTASFGELMFLKRRLEELMEADLNNAKAGLYPRRLLFGLPAATYLGQLPRALADIPSFLARARRGDFSDLPQDIPRQDYPSYYLRNFHWQRDGWFSQHSAQMYDFSVELLFGGAADVMRRMIMPPLVNGLAGSAGSPRVLDIACGTGRIMKVLLENIEGIQLTGLDLSPAYLAEARRHLQPTAPVSLVHDRAEAMPFSDGRFDAAYSIFLFHELPKDVRRDVMREAFRVIRPGGAFVVCDAAQLVESPQLQVSLENFEQLYHEPYFKSYIRDDLAECMTQVGFDVVHSSAHFVSKVVAGQRPMQA